jgi:hypothetical protein
MKHNLNVGKGVRIASVLLLLVIGLPGLPVSARQTQSLQAGNSYIFDTYYYDLANLGVQGLTGLVYSPRADVLMALHKQTGKSGQSLAMVNREEDGLVGDSILNSQPADALNIAFNGKANSMFSFDPAKQELSAIPADAKGALQANASVTGRYNLRGVGIQQAQGMAFDPATGQLFLLDPSGKRLITVAPDAAGSYDGDKAGREKRLNRIDLKSIGAKHLRGLAINPNTGNLFTIDPDTKTLYEITQQGALVSTRDMSSFEYDLQNTSGMVFAPSGDSTDDPAIQNLYVADTGANRIAEISITPAVLAALPAASSISLVNTILTYKWNPPSPDTSGLSYNPFTNQLQVSDSEVDEMSIYQGVNAYRSSLSGSLQSTCDTTSFTHEPSGLGVNTDNGDIYYSDDGQKIIYQAHLGPDGKYCTGDDFVTSTDTKSYGDYDPEGMEYGNGKIYITDGKNAEVYVVSLGPNGILDGAPPKGDDTFYHWDTASLGLRDPEGIGFQPVNGTLMIVSRADKILLETTVDGQPLRQFDISFSNILKPAGVGVGPGSKDSSNVNVYVSQRGVDNNSNPNENDGKIFEFNVGDFYGSPPPPTPTPQPTQTPDLIFADGFEAGSLSAWSSSTTDGGNLSVGPAAALVGTSGMQALINDNNAIFVRDDSPNAEAVYNARFYFDPNSISMTSGDNHFILYGYSGTKVVLRVQFRFYKGAYQIRAGLQNNAATWTDASYVTLSDAPHAIEVDWRAATGSGANNGGLTFWIDGAQVSGISGIANDTYKIDSVRLGAVNGVDTGTRGTEFFDAFESHRQTTVGP